MFTYKVCDLLTRKELGTLDLTNVTFGDPLMDHGQLSGTVSVSADSNISHLKDMLDVSRGASAIYVMQGSQILWPGIIKSAPWPQKGGQIALQADHAAQYLTEVFHGIGTTTTKWVNKDQLQIARELVSYVTSRPGTPKIKVGTETSGILRDLTIEPQSFQDISDLLDTMANRDDGFQWTIQARLSSADGLPELYLSLWYPERQSSEDTKLILSQTTDGGNIISRGDWPNDATQRRTRIYAIGDGEAPSTMVATDEDPNVSTGVTVLREKTTSYAGQGITKAATLADHARSERYMLAQTTGTLTIDVPIDNPNVTDYLTGDRTRLILKDEWLDVDLPAVKIVDRTIHDEDRDSTASVTLTLDVGNYEAGLAMSNRPNAHDEAAAWNEIQKRITRLERQGLSIPQIENDPDALTRANIWMLPDGSFRWRDAFGVIHQANTAAISGGGSLPSNPLPQTYTKTYSATFGQAYNQPSDTKANTSALWFGFQNNNLYASMIGFPYASIATDLSGATIKKVEVYLDIIGQYSRSALTVYFGYHTHATEPTTYSATAIRKTSATWAYKGSGFKTISTDVGTQLKNGTIKGLTIDPFTRNAGFSGTAAGLSGGGSVPKLRITYVK